MGFGIDANALDVTDLDAVKADGSANGDLLDFREIGEQAIFRAERAGTGNVENSDGQDGESDEHEDSDSQFGPGKLFALCHDVVPPSFTAKSVLIISVPPRMLFGRRQKLFYVRIGGDQHRVGRSLKINFPVAKNQHGSGVRGVALFAALGEFFASGQALSMGPSIL